MTNWMYDINPKDSPDSITVVTLHEGGGSMVEGADFVASWIVETLDELRTVLATLDELIEGTDDEHIRSEVWYAVQSIPRELHPSSEAVAEMFHQALNQDDE